MWTPYPTFLIACIKWWQTCISRLCSPFRIHCFVWEPISAAVALCPRGSRIRYYSLNLVFGTMGILLGRKRHSTIGETITQPSLGVWRDQRLQIFTCSMVDDLQHAQRLTAFLLGKDFSSWRCIQEEMNPKQGACIYGKACHVPNVLQGSL